MGNTTIIELNHDLYDQIEKDPAKWADDLLRHMRGHAYSDRVRIGGGQIVTTFHRGDSDEYDLWIKFREAVLKRQDKTRERYGSADAMSEKPSE